MPLSMASTSPKSLTSQGKGGAFRVAAAVDVERRGGEIDAEADAAGAVDGVQTANPDGGILAFGLLVGG